MTNPKEKVTIEFSAEQDARLEKLAEKMGISKEEAVQEVAKLISLAALGSRNRAMPNEHLIPPFLQ